MKGGWLVCRQPNPAARLRLLCFAYAGGGSSVFAGWTRRLPPEVEVCAVRLPGRESRLPQRPYRRVEDLLPDLGKVASGYCEKPFALFGHSMGALVAFEFAHWMRNNTGRAPEHLMVSARRAPHLAHNQPLVHDLPDDAVIKRLRELGGAPDALLADRRTMRLVMPGLRADFQLNDTYRYRRLPALSCPITAFGGLADPHVDRAGLVAWVELTSGPFNLCMVEGGHLFLHSAQDTLLGHISEALQCRDSS